MESIPRMSKEAEAAVRAVMSDFDVSGNRAGFIAGNPGYGFDLTPDIVREPAVLFYLLHYVLGFLNLGTFEKSAWECTSTYRGVESSIALQKFGLRLYLDRRTFTDSVSAGKAARPARKAIQKALRIVEAQFLVGYGEEQLVKGMRIPAKAISQSGVFDHPRSEAAERPTLGRGSPPDDHLLSGGCG